MPRKHHKLATDAYPTIFPNQPSYHTVKLLQERRKPEDRLQEVLLREQEELRVWCEQDNIVCFDSFTAKVKDRDVEPFISIIKEDYVLFINVVDIKYSDVPTLSVSFKVSKNFDVCVFYKNLCLPVEKFSWILQSEGSEDLKCNKWSKLDNLVSCLANYSYDNIPLTDQVTSLVNVVKEGLLVDSDIDIERTGKIKFALEQLELSLATRNKY